MTDHIVSRRRFLQAAGAAGIWTAGSSTTASGAEPRPVAVESAREVGISKWDLDTPALIVDLDALEANLSAMQQTVRRNRIASPAARQNPQVPGHRSAPAC